MREYKNIRYCVLYDGQVLVEIETNKTEDKFIKAICDDEFAERTSFGFYNGIPGILIDYEFDVDWLNDMMISPEELMAACEAFTADRQISEHSFWMYDTEYNDKLTLFIPWFDIFPTRIAFNNVVTLINIIGIENAPYKFIENQEEEVR